MIANEILEQLPSIAVECSAADVRVGLGYTAVLLDNGCCGVAYTLHEKEYESCSVIPESGTLTGRKASDLASWLRSPDETACAIGLATVNALIRPPSGAVESDVMELLPVGSDDSVGMVGYFGPLVGPLTERARVLYVFERRPVPDSGVLPESAARELLPQCQVVILSATTLLTQTIDDLLGYCKAAHEIAILGPSTPFMPEVFRRRGVTMLSGLQVVDAPKILRIVSEGGGTRQFGRAVRKLTLRTKLCAYKIN